MVILVAGAIKKTWLSEENKKATTIVVAFGIN
jgi:hypothetical protein